MSVDPSPPDVPPPPPRKSPLAFAIGFVVALVIAPMPTIFIGMLFSQERTGGPWLAVVAELAVFGVLVWLVRRRRWTGFPQGLVTGLAVAFLLAGACWGIVASWR